MTASPDGLANLAIQLSPEQQLRAACMERALAHAERVRWFAQAPGIAVIKLAAALEQFVLTGAVSADQAEVSDAR